jgi:hypothetical protein
MPSSAEAKMHVDDLPIEIMEEIFHMHVYEHLGSRNSLLLTSKRWYAIATSQSSLWRSISWGGNCEMALESVKCRTLNDLACAIRMTGQATFDLNIGGPFKRPNSEEMTEFISSIDRKWLSRCHSLTIWTLGGDADNITVEILEQFLRCSTLDALERVVWDCHSHGSRKLGMSMLMGVVELSSLRLRALRLKYGFGNYHTQEFPSQYTGLFKRIRSLTLVFVCQPVPWREFTKLEHLDYSRIARHGPRGLYDTDIPLPSNLSELVAPRLTSLCLEGEFTRSDFPSKDLLRQLKRLVLRWFTTAQDENIFPEAFPSLHYLGLGTYWYDANLYSIFSSGIHELDISSIGNRFAPTWLDMALAPRVLRVDGRSPLIRHVANPLPIWDRLEEIHLTVQGDHLVPTVLVDALSYPTPVASLTDSPRHRDCFPQLKVFTIRYPTMAFRVFREDPPSEEEMQKRADVLRLVFKRRQESGLSRLERLQVGWYWRYGSDFVIGDPRTDRRITSWTDCSYGGDV